VRDGVGERWKVGRQVGVDVDPRLETAVVPVVGRPRLVPDPRDTKLLALRESEQVGSTDAEALQQEIHHRRPSLGGDRKALVPRLDPRGDVALAGKQVVDRARGGVEVPFGDAPRCEVEGPRDVLLVRDAVAGQCRGLRLERHELHAQPRATVRFGDVAHHAVTERGRVVAERRR
jgi:hypothetical protein